MARDETIKLSLIDGVTRTLGQIRDGVSGVGASLVKLNQGAELAAKGFGAVASAASAIGGAVQGAADLESALAALQAVTGASAAEFATLREAAISASERTRFTAIEAAEGLTELARAGLSAKEAVDVLNPALFIAQGNNISLAESSSILTTTIKQFGASMQEAATFADVLQLAADSTDTSITQLGNAMSYVAPLARQAGTSVQETSAAIGALAEQGFRGERAGTALRNVFSALADPASKFSEALSDAGIRSRDFSTVIEALGKKGDAAKKILLALDSEARPAILSLVNGGGGAIADLTRKLEESAGAAERTSEILGDTFNGAVARLQNSVTNLRNEFLAPILQPLADEAVALAEKINALGDSPQFARIRDQFQELATNAIRSVGDLIEKADLEAWAGNVADFAADAKTAFDGLVVVVKTTAGAIRGIGAAIDYVAERGAAFDALFGEADKSLNGFNAAAQNTSRSLSHLGPKLDANKKSTRELGDAANAGAGNVRVFAVEVDRAAEDLRQIPPAAKLSVQAINELAATAASVSIAGLESQLQGLVRAQADLANSGVTSGAEFQRLTQQIGQTEQEIQRLKDSSKGASDATKDLAGSADTAGNSLKGFSNAAAGASNAADDLKSSNSQVSDSFGNIGNQADTAGNSLKGFSNAAAAASNAADDLKSSNSQVSDSFGNIGNQSSETAISLGNLSEEFVRQALEAAGAAKSASDYARTLSGYFAAGSEQDEKIKARLDRLSRQIAALSEEEQIRKRLARQYGESSTLLDELARKELELARAKKQANDEAERGIEIEQRRNAGGVNFGQPAAAAESGATSSRGSAAGGGRSAPQIVINVQGMTTDQARQFVEQSVVPELERINRLSR